jgi:signal transduction histidine kinase
VRTDGPEGRIRLLSASARLALALTCAVLLVTGSAPHRIATLGVLLGLITVGVAASQVRVTSLSTRLATLLEAALWAAAALIDHGRNGPLLPYLLAPALAGGLAFGLEGVALPVGIAAVAILAGAPALSAGEELAQTAGGAAEWISLALLVGLLASWVNRLSDGPDPSYVEAYQLLGQLRTLTRELPVGLDSAGLAEELLRDLQTRFPDLIVGAVYTRSPGNLPAVRATTGQDRMTWRVDLSEGSVFSRAWIEQQPETHPLEDGKSLLVLPLVVAERTIGLAALELQTALVPGEVELSRTRRSLDNPALKLETAMLFDELREVATVEERRRLAREIHDGIAQDLAAFGYQLDGLARSARKGAAAEDLGAEITGIRAELGRLVAELRSSIFELRTEVDQHGGLGAALTEYVRAVGAASAMTVHLSLDERPERLPSDIEAELLRIAQEAVTNARRHGQARNLWVRCQLAPPHAVIVVQDDGESPSDGLGLQIMRERAHRLRAELHVEERFPKGTVVTCRLGPPL